MTLTLDAGVQGQGIGADAEPIPASGESAENNFDFLRFMFAVWVVYSHAFALVKHGNGYFDISDFTGGQTFLGHIALQGFFVISGYLITMSWMRSNSTLDFMRRRLLRIYPGYIVACAVSVLVVAPMGSDSVAEYYRNLAVVPLVSRIATLGALPLLPIFPDSPIPGEVNGSLWSIRIEFECYLLLPLLALLGLLRWRWLILALTGGALVMNAMMEPPIRDLLPFRFSESMVSHTTLAVYFLCGMTAYLYRDHFGSSARLMWGSLAMIALTAKLGAFNATLPITGSYLLFVAAFSQRWRVHRFSKRMDLSYGLYLYGWPVKRVVTSFMGATINPYLLFAVALPATLVLAAFSWFAIEKPTLRFKLPSSFGPRRVPRQIG